MEFSICVHAYACPIVCRSKNDRCTRRGLSGRGVQVVEDIFPSCSVFLVWCQSSFASDVSNSGFAWPLLWEFWHPCTPSRNRSDCPSASGSRIWEIWCPTPCRQITRNVLTQNCANVFYFFYKWVIIIDEKLYGYEIHEYMN